MNRSHQEYREALGAYVLDQLDKTERDDLDAHLITCADCRAEVAELTPLALGLRDVDPDRLMPVGITTPLELDERIRAILPAPTAASPSRMRGWKPAIAGLAVGIAASAIIAVSLPSGGSTPVAGPTIIPVAQVKAERGVTASAGLVDHSWGVEIKLTTTGLPAGRSYDVKVIAKDGTEYDAGEFVGVADATINCNMSSSVLLADATGFTVVDGSGHEVISAPMPS